LNPTVAKKVELTAIALCELIQVKATEEKKLAVANPNSELPQLVTSVAQLVSTLR